MVSKAFRFLTQFTVVAVEFLSSSDFLSWFGFSSLFELCSCSSFLRFSKTAASQFPGILPYSSAEPRWQLLTLLLRSRVRFLPPKGGKKRHLDTHFRIGVCSDACNISASKDAHRGKQVFFRASHIFWQYIPFVTARLCPLRLS